jgi:ornithine racemase
MSAPRVEIDLGRIHHNARTLVDRLAVGGIAVTGVTKAALGSPAIARAMLRAGVRGLGDSRLANIEALRRAPVAADVLLLRSPMRSQVDRVVALADASCNTEPEVIAALAAAARSAGRTHGIVVMVELGDLREGVLPGDLAGVVGQVLGLPGLALRGIGTNLACQSGVAPAAANMAELSALAVSVEAAFGITVEVVSGGNSANLAWALGGAPTGRVNDLRLGEAILLGCEPLFRQPIEGLHGDAFTLVAEVIEDKVKPSKPWGEIGQAAFGAAPAVTDRGDARRTIVALGRQDVEPAGLVPPPGVTVLGASSDHLVLDCGRQRYGVGAEMAFGLDYAALVRVMTSPFVARVMTAPPGSGLLGPDDRPR